METTLAILMVLGIFIGIPAVIGLGIAGMYTQSDRRVRRDQRAKALAEAVAEALQEQTTTVPVKVIAEDNTQAA